MNDHECRIERLFVCPCGADVWVALERKDRETKQRLHSCGQVAERVASKAVPLTGACPQPATVFT